MKTVFITTSPKKHHWWSNSTYLASLVRFASGESETLRLQGKKDYEVISKACSGADNVVFAMPLFVDGIPAHVLAFLQEVEQNASSWHCRVYVLCCCGFYEGRQTHLLLDQIKCWCGRTGLTYAGGLGVGGTEMLGVIRLTNLFCCIPMGLISGIITAISSSDAHKGMVSGTISFIIPLMLYLLWSSGLFYHSVSMGSAIRKGKQVSNRYTTVWFCGRVLFTFFASIYWIVRAAKNRVSFMKMWHKEQFQNDSRQAEEG